MEVAESEPGPKGTGSLEVDVLQEQAEPPVLELGVVAARLEKLPGRAAVAGSSL